MSTIIKLRCIDQVLTFESTPVIASGGVEEDVLSVSFCSKWDGMAKTAVFWRSEDDAYHVLLDLEDSCTIPREVLATDGVLYFGLFGVSADGRQRTTEVMRYVIAKGSITENTKPSDPTPDVYTQLLSDYAEVVVEMRAIAEAAEASRQAAEAAVEISGSFQTQLDTRYMLSGGTEIPESADLNTYLTPGNYYCPKSGTAATVLNCPVSGAFTMKVSFSSGIQYVNQEVRSFSSGIVYRRYNSKASTDNPAWSEWKDELQKNGVTATAKELNVLDGITATTTELNHTAGVTAPIQTQLDGKIPAVTKFHSANVSIDDLTVPLALISMNETANSEVHSLLGGSWAYVLTFFYEAQSVESNRVQIALTYSSSPSKMIFRHYFRGAWDPWQKVPANLSDLGLEVTETEVNYLAGLTGPIMDLLAELLPKSGGTLTGGLLLQASDGSTVPFLHANNASLYMRTLGFKRVASGTYAGSDEDQIVACGFRPSMYILSCYDGHPSDGNYLAIYMPGHGLLLFGNEGEIILGGVADTGISLSDSSMNAFGCAYTYIAFE